MQRVDNVVSGNKNLVTSNAVYNALASLNNSSLQILSRSQQAGSENWGNSIVNEDGSHIYILIANRVSVGNNYFALINTYGNSGNKNINPTELVNQGFTLSINNVGTLNLSFSADPSNLYNYSYSLFKLV